MSGARALGALTREALADAVRRRVVPLVAVTALLSLWLVDSCTGCAGGAVARDGRVLAASELAGFTGMLIFAALALWTVALAGLLASDHLAETLADGSASLTLARPVGRGTFAAARLLGVLAIALATGAALLGVTAALLHARHGLAPGAALASALACALGALTAAALSMAISLALPRIATALLILAGVAATAAANAAALFGAPLGATAGLLDRFGPPLLAAVVAPLAPWLGALAPEVDAGPLAARLAVWAALSVGALALAVRRVELR